MYGFEGEVKAKYNAKMAELFTEIFNCKKLRKNGNPFFRFAPLPFDK